MMAPSRAPGKTVVFAAGSRFKARVCILHVLRRSRDSQNLPGHGTDLILILTHLKEGTPSTEFDDLSTLLYKREKKHDVVH